MEAGMTKKKDLWKDQAEKDMATLSALRDALHGAGLRSEGKYVFVTVEDPKVRGTLLGLLADLRDRVR